MGMDINKLLFDKSIYPRGRDLNSDEEIKPDDKNVEKIKDVLEETGKINHKITYNKRTMHIIDGTHLWNAMRQLGWKEVPKEYLNEIDVPEESEIAYAVHYNASHGKALSREEMKACLAELIDIASGRMKWGKLKEVAELWKIKYKTLQIWLEEIKTGTYHQKELSQLRQSNKNDDSGTEIIEDLQQTKKELEKTRIKLDEANKRNEEFEIKWNSVCPTHKRAISICKDCGKKQ